MKNRRRINPSAEPHAQGHVGNQVLAHRVFEQSIELFFRGSQRVSTGDAEGQAPIRAGRNLAVPPLQPPSRRELFDALNERPGRRDVVQSEVAIEPGQAQPAVHLGMDEEGL